MKMNNEKKFNPANGVELPKGFKPLGAATQRLDAPVREGYHRRWIRGTPERLGRAHQAGYTFVSPEDVDINNFDLGGDANASGNTDMGTRVSVISGDELDKSGQPGRLYLMECREEYYEVGRKILAERNESVAEALRGGMLGAGQNDETYSDQQKRYRKGNVPDLFNPHKNRR